MFSQSVLFRGHKTPVAGKVCVSSEERGPPEAHVSCLDAHFLLPRLLLAISKFFLNELCLAKKRISKLSVSSTQADRNERVQFV